MPSIGGWARGLRTVAAAGMVAVMGWACAEQPVEPTSGVVVDYQGRSRTDPSPVAPFGELRMRALRPGDVAAFRAAGPMLVADSSTSGKAHFVRLTRYSTEQQTWLTMDPDTAFSRDLYAGADWFVQNAQDGDSWNVTFTMANGSVISSPDLRFVATLGSETNCFISGLSHICGFTGVFIESYFTSQCGATGPVKVNFTENSSTWGSDTFYIKNQLPDSAVPTFNQVSYPADAYDNQCTRTDSTGYFACARDSTGALLPGYETVPIRDLGCALTTAANTLVYFGLTVDPPTLNTWLKDNGGYSRGGAINWAKIGEYARTQLGTDIGTPIYYAVDSNATTAQFDSARTLLATQICRYGLSSVKVYHTKRGRQQQHWVSVYGRTLDTTSFRISDPNGGGRATLATPYNNNPYKIVFWRRTTPSDPSHLGLHLNSPAEMLVTDPLGRRIGVDPTSGARYQEIPDAAYSTEFLNGDGDNDDQRTHESKELLIPHPAAGTYQVQVTGTGTGTYSMDLDAQYQNDQSSQASVPDTPTWPGAVHSYSFTYSPAGGPAPVLDHGSFTGGGQSADADELITYSSPGTKSTTVPGGVNSASITLYLSPDVTTSTVVLTWNGQNVTPAGLVAGTAVRLSLPLSAGRNIFQASADGVIAGRKKSDSDRLVFIK